MIAGEMTTMLERELDTGEYYDNFLFFGKKKDKGKGPDDAEKKAKRKAFMQKVGQTFNQMGGAQGIGQTIDSVRGLFGKPKTDDESPSDYEIKVGDKPKPDPSPEKKVPVAVWIVAALAVGGLSLWLITRSKASPQP